MLCTKQRTEEKWPFIYRLSEASETAVHGVRKWSGKTSLEIIITGPSADLGLRGLRLPAQALRMEHSIALAPGNLATPH